MSKKPIIGITMGDPSGIGPEIIIKSLQNKEVYKMCIPVVIGKYSVFDLDGNEEYEYGILSSASGDIAFRSIKKVIELAMKGQVDGTVTAPINKEALHLSGHKFSGHTEIYAHFTETKKYTMLLVCNQFRVVHVSTHVSLREACDLVKKDRVYDVIRLSNDACVQLGITQPKIGVAGLNPHAGENGLFGDEEIKEIIPAVQRAKREGYCVEGPVSPDSLFPQANSGLFDIAVAMYHDQGHIPLKTVGFQWNQAKKEWSHVNGVNITLGLPIIRTSVDHGTAYEIAGKGVASEQSMTAAIEYAVKLAEHKMC